MFDSYDHYEEVIIKNDITYIYGNNFEECINILKNKFQYINVSHILILKY